MGWRVGEPFKALDTSDVRSAGITPGAGGEVTSILGANSFGSNFAPDKSKETARRTFRDARIFPQTFPGDFLQKKK